MRALLLPLLALCSLRDGVVRPAVAQQPLFIERDSVRVVFWHRDRGMAERTLRAATTPLPLPGLPGTVRARGTIYLAPTPQRFDSLTGGVAPEWSSGVAFPERRVVVLPAYPSSRTPQQDPIVALRHELIHLALHAYLPGRSPRWFDEGYATWASGGWDEGSGWEIRLALLRGAAPPLDSLTLQWPGAAVDARLAYLLSASAVRFLAARAGPEAFAAFLRTWRERGDWDIALREVYRLTPSQLEREWRGMVKRRYGWLLALSQIGVFWAVIAVLLLVLGSARRRRNRERLASMEAEEKLQLPEEEFWLEEAGADEAPGGVDEGLRRE